MRRLIFIALLTIAGCALPRAATVTVGLKWDQHPDPRVTGFNVYQGASNRTYGLVRFLGLETNTVLPLMEVPTNYFAVTAYDAIDDDESDYSVEIVVPFTTNSSFIVLTIPRLVTVTNIEPVNPPANAVAVPGVMFSVVFTHMTSGKKTTNSVFVQEGENWFTSATAMPTNAVPKAFAKLQTIPRSPPMPSAVKAAPVAKPKHAPKQGHR